MPEGGRAAMPCLEGDTRPDGHQHAPARTTAAAAGAATQQPQAQLAALYTTGQLERRQAVAAGVQLCATCLPGV